MTTGQRIAQKRKELGLSQEALGEKLGVSRQAIYKWESDTSLPEIEKLVQISRCFQVSIGWLLGEESETVREQERKEPELSEEQLKSIEEIVKRYATQPTPKAQPTRRWITVGCAVLALVCIFTLTRKLSDLQKKLTQLQNTVSQERMYNDNRIYDITRSVEDVLNRVNSFAAEHSVEIVSCDYKNNEITFGVSATPKTYVDGMIAVFKVECDEITIEQLGEQDGSGFSATLTCPLGNTTVVSVTFVDGSRRDYQPLITYYDLYGQSFPFVYELGSLWLDITNGKLEESLVILNADPMYNEIPPAEIAEVKCGLFSDRKLVQWYTQTEKTPGLDGFDDSYGTYYYFTRERIPLEPGREYCNAIFVTDIYGRTIVYNEAGVLVYEHGNNEISQTAPEDNANDPANWQY